MANGDITSDAQVDMELKKTVETFLDVILDRVEDVVNQRQRDSGIQESVAVFYSGVLNDVAKRLTEDWDKTTILIEENRLKMKKEIEQMVSREERRNDKLSNISRGLHFILPVTTAIQEVPIFSLQKGLANMIPLATLMVPEAGQLNPNMANSASPANMDNFCLQHMKNKENKAKKFNLWKAWKIPKKENFDDQQADEGKEKRENRKQKPTKKRDKTSCSIADALKLTLPVTTMIVPLVADNYSRKCDGNRMKTGFLSSPDTMVGLPSDSNLSREVKNEDDVLCQENVEMIEKSNGIEEKQIKLTRWTKLRQCLNTIFKRTNETKSSYKTVEKVADNGITVIDLEKADTEIKEDIVIKSSAAKQKPDMKTTIRRKLRKVSRHLRCRA